MIGDVVLRRSAAARARLPLARRLSGGLLIAFVALLAALALLGGTLAPQDPNAVHLSEALQGPSWAHPMGTDKLGRDYFSRMLTGARTTLGTGILIALIATVGGSLIGFTAGWVGGRVDGALMRVLDVVMVFPGILLALIGVAVLGPSTSTAVIAVGLTMIVPVARVARATMLKLREEPLVESARMAGAGDVAVVFAHLVPNALVPIIVQGSLIAADAILIVAGLGYLGVGAQPPTAEWGVMLSESQSALSTGLHLAIFPGVAILVAALAFNLVGDRFGGRLQGRS